MKNSYQATGTNSKALFTFKIHRGDGMVLLAMNWRTGQPPRDFVGFAIEYKEPKSDQFWPVRNRIGFPGQRKKPSDPTIPSTRAPFQKFRWVHFPFSADKEGEFHYRITPMFMDEGGTLSRGEPQEASIALMRDNGIPIVVFSIRERGNLLRVLHGEGVFTTIASDRQT